MVAFAPARGYLQGVPGARYHLTPYNVYRSIEGYKSVSVFHDYAQAVIVTIWDAVLCGFDCAHSSGSDSSVDITAIGLTVVIYLAAYVLFLSLGFCINSKKGNMSVNSIFLEDAR